MPLIAFVGDMGSGKTTSMTYFAWRNFRAHRKIYANYHLMFKYKPITSIEEIEDMHEGFFAGDELWLWLDSRESGSKKNKVIGSILAKSRKRDLDIAFTAQSFRQIDIRIRNVTDLIATPILKFNEKVCILYVYNRHNLAKPQNIIKFLTKPVFKLFDHREEVRTL